MTLTDALNQLREWCDRSGSQPLEVLPGRKAVFESRSVHTAAELRDVEIALDFQFPDSYRKFMQTIGASSLFSWSPHGGGPRFYTPAEVIAASETATYTDEAGADHRFCFVGEHRLMGDFMGFLMTRPGDSNFDVFCHEYPFDEYVAVSDEIQSWRSFEDWLVRCVESKGEDSI